MNNDALAAWLTLANTGFSHAVVRRLLARFPGPGGILGAPDRLLQSEAGLDSGQCRRLREAQEGHLQLRRQIDVFHRFGMKLVHSGQSVYPANLRAVSDPPPFLFVRGELREEDRLAVGIVGARLSTPYGLEVARRLAVELAPVVTVISGLAHGIDTAAHANTLDAGGRTIGVAACGLDQDYPRGAGPLHERIVESGALVSCFPPLAGCGRGNFPRRNYILAGLGLALVVVEATEKSGSLVTAAAAVEENREVFAVPSDITRPAGRGTNRLIAEGACVVTEPLDVLRHLEGRLSSELESLRQARAATRADPAAPLPAELSAAEQALLTRLRSGKALHDDLLAAFVPDSFTVGQISTALLQLEMKGLVRQLPGRVYEAR
ncbi:MAG: processing protein [Candidatus Sumerlaeota bacterium]|nr:processing protein [Candidatus Sumerlaeota bacterium]